MEASGDAGEAPHDRDLRGALSQPFVARIGVTALRRIAQESGNSLYQLLRRVDANLRSQKRKEILAMRINRNTATTAAALSLLVSALLAAQPPMRGRGMRMYDPSTETKITGTVDSVTQGARGHMMGTHLTVKTERETKEVALGPSDFISGKGFSFAKGDKVEVTGSNVTMGGMSYLIAREIVKDGKTLTLRDKTGRPEWAGSRMGAPMGPGSQPK